MKLNLLISVKLLLLSLIFLLLLLSSNASAKRIEEPKDCNFGDITIRGTPFCRSLLDDYVGLPEESILCDVTLKTREELKFISSIGAFIEIYAQKSGSTEWQWNNNEDISSSELRKEGHIWNETVKITRLPEGVWKIKFEIWCLKNEEERNFINDEMKTIHISTDIYKTIENYKLQILTSQVIAKEQLKATLMNAFIGLIGVIVGSVLTYTAGIRLTEKRLKKERFLRACEDVNASMVECFYSINEAGNVQPKTLVEYQTIVEAPKDKFENALNINSIWFDNKILDTLNDVRGAFRQASRAIFMELPKKELKGFPIEPYPKEYRRIDWSKLNKSFKNARKIFREKLEL